MLKPTAFLTLLVVVMFSAAASGQVQALRYTYVSPTGSDTNSCARSTPCRQITKALTVTQNGGTVTVLETGEYNNFTVTQSVSVVGDKGAQAMIVSTNPNPNAGVYINDTAAPYSSVTLRGLVIKENTNGIIANGQVGTVTVEDCTIEAVHYTIGAQAPGDYLVRNTHVRYGLYGMWFDSPNGEVRAVVEGSSFKNIGTQGLYAGNSAKVTVTNSLAEGNKDGFAAGLSARLFLENCRSIGNADDGVTVSGSAWVRISNSTIVNNQGYGVRSSGGYARTYGNNRLANNSLGSTSGTFTLLDQQ